MAPPSNMNPEESLLLDQHMERYMAIHAGNKKYTQFWAMIRQQWFQKWPAIETLYPGREPNTLNPLEVETVRRYIKAQMKTITNWYRWRANINNRTGARAPKLETILREALTDTTIVGRTLCDWQMYSVHYYEERVKPGVDQELSLLLVQNNGEPVSRGIRMGIVVRHIKEMFAKESAETKQSIAELVAQQQEEKKVAAKAVKESMDVDDGDKAEEGVSTKPDLRSTQRAVNSIPTLLDDTFTWIHKNTGYYLSAVFVGKDPRNGKLVTGSFHYGKDQFGFDFGTSYKDFHNAVMVPYTHFVQGLMDAEAKKEDDALRPQVMGNNPLKLHPTASSDTTLPPPVGMESLSESSTKPDKGKGMAIAQDYRYQPNPATINILNTHPLFTMDGGSSSTPLTDLCDKSWEELFLEEGMSSSYDGSDAGGLHRMFESDQEMGYSSEGGRSTGLGGLSDGEFDSSGPDFASLHINPSILTAGSNDASGLGVPVTLSHSSLQNHTITTPLRFTTAEESSQRFQQPADQPPLILPSPNHTTVPRELTMTDITPPAPASLTQAGMDLFGKLDAISINTSAPVPSIATSPPLNGSDHASSDSHIPVATTPPTLPDVPPPVLSLPPSSLPIPPQVATAPTTLPLDVSANVYNAGTAGTHQAMTDEQAEQHRASFQTAAALVQDPRLDTLSGDTVDTTRRSSRPVIPSKRVEEANSIGSNVAKKTNITSETPASQDWISELKVVLLNFQGGEAWLKCVEKWAQFEEGVHYTTAKGYLPSIEHRPSEWATWTSNGRRHDRKPLIDEPTDFGIALAKWWHAMQPTFRHNEGVMPSAIFTDLTGEHGESWTLLRRGGPNGFSSIVIMLLWWGQALSATSVWQDDSSSAWKDLLGDVASVLDAMMGETVSLKGVKRKGTTASGIVGKRGSKRGRG